LPLIFNQVIAKNPKAQLILVGRDASDIATGSTSTWQLMQHLFTPEALKQVRYLGGVPYEAVRTHIAQASVCVFPTFAEALPVSWLEAMAMEKAIVASNIGWGPEVIASGKEGILVHPKDHETYANAILELLENESLNTIFGQQAAQKIQAVFANSLIAEQSVAFYQTIIDNKK
jgi:glycosyltransferase involved in cell wall biosynthesis